jgi:hypothetical protein
MPKLYSDFPLVPSDLRGGTQQDATTPPLLATSRLNEREHTWLLLPPQLVSPSIIQA